MTEAISSMRYNMPMEHPTLVAQAPAVKDGSPKRPELKCKRTFDQFYSDCRKMPLALSGQRQYADGHLPSPTRQYPMMEEAPRLHQNRAAATPEIANPKPARFVDIEQLLEKLEKEILEAEAKKAEAKEAEAMEATRRARIRATLRAPRDRTHQSCRPGNGCHCQRAQSPAQQPSNSGQPVRSTVSRASLARTIRQGVPSPDIRELQVWKIIQTTLASTEIREAPARTTSRIVLVPSIREPQVQSTSQTTPASTINRTPPVSLVGQNFPYGIIGKAILALTVGQATLENAKIRTIPARTISPVVLIPSIRPVSIINLTPPVSLGGQNFLNGIIRKAILALTIGPAHLGGIITQEPPAQTVGRAVPSPDPETQEEKVQSASQAALARNIYRLRTLNSPYIQPETTGPNINRAPLASTMS
ncbi:hypothetical protein F4821DRAFT_261069 [Hypoxylon rubiginosum]|uniref:Uncharacterized protein n=1 Tax=Hypoxylon rubiginosum TaxID=110542 RepID=A0ACC0CYK6_9PEZI|nr:hypothetical protein F4821DRAFT_261069 [Hypoxylon rubiginosum]